MAKNARSKKKTAAKKRTRKAWSRAQVAELRRHSKSRTNVMKLEKIVKRSGPTLRQKARNLGLSPGHTKRRKKR